MKALISKVESGRICDVVEKEFDVTDDFYWVDVPDDTTTTDSFDETTKQVVKYDPVKQPGFAEMGYIVARGIAYKSVGEQMDMIYKELAQTGTLSSDGPWATHITKVKADIPKDDPQAVYEYVKADWERRQAEEAAAASPASNLGQ